MGFFYGWVIVLISAIGLLFSLSTLVALTFGIFMRALAEEFGWNRAEISLAYSIALLLLAIASPLIGKMVDRWGARRVITLAAVLFGGALMSLALLTPRLWHFYLVFSAVVIIGGGASLIPYNRVISTWFDRRRGLALGLSMAGLGIGAFLMPALAHYLITHWGWRTAYAVLGSFPIAIVAPLVGLWFREEPEDLGLLPDGRPDSSMRSASGAEGAWGMSPSEALRTRTFWIMGTAFFLMSLCVIGIMVHLAPLLMDRGFSEAQAAWAMSVFGVALLLGRVTCGILLDRFFAPYVGASFFGAAAIGILLLWLEVQGVAAFFAAFLVGLVMGAEVDVIAYLVSRYFGLRSFGEIYGYGFSLYLLGGMVGPPLMGANFEALGSYSEVLLGMLGAVLVAAVLMTRLGEYQTEVGWGRWARA